MIKRSLVIQIVLVFSFVSLNSCIDPIKNADYIGTWQFTEKITSNDVVLNTTRTMILTSDTYEETYLIQRENSTVISAILGTRGNLSPARFNLVFELKEIGTCRPGELQKCTEEVDWYGEGTQFWIDNVSSYQKQKTITGAYEISETTLRLTRDLNDDGDYSDSGEDVIFEKKNPGKK